MRYHIDTIPVWDAQKLEGECLLCARSGDTIFMLRAPADEQTVYALGAGAVLE